MLVWFPPNTKRNSKEWSKKVVTSLKIKNKKITSATAWGKDHRLMFIAFWDCCNSSGLDFVWTASFLLAGTNQRSAWLDRLHRQNNRRLCSNILFTSEDGVCALWAELHYHLYYLVWLSKEMWMASHWRNSTIISTKLHAAETKHDNVL